MNQGTEIEIHISYSQAESIQQDVTLYS